MAAKNPPVILPRNVEVAIASIRQLGNKINTWCTGMEEASLRVFSSLSPAQIQAINEDYVHTLESLNDPMGKIFEKRMKTRIDEIRKAFVSESSTDPTSMFLRDFNIRFVDYFDKFISWSAGSVCHQLVESPRLLNAESTDTQIFIQLQIRGPRPLSDSLTQEIFVTVQSCGMPFFGPATLDKLLLLNFARESSDSIISVELPTSAAYSLKQGLEVSVEVVLSGEQIPGSPFTLVARPDKGSNEGTDSRSLWTNVGEGNVPIASHNLSRLDDSDMRCVINESVMLEVNEDQRLDALNRSAFNKSRSNQSRHALTLPPVQEVSVENSFSGSSAKHGPVSDDIQDVALRLFRGDNFAHDETKPVHTLEESRDVIFPDFDITALDYTILDASMLNHTSILHKTWDEHSVVNPTEKMERLAVLVNANQSARTTNAAFNKPVSDASLQPVKNMLEPITSGLTVPLSTLGTPKSVRSKVEGENQPISSPIVASAESRRVFLEKMNSGPLAPEVSSTVNFSDALSRMLTMRRPELTTMEEETSVDDSNDGESGAGFGLLSSRYTFKLKMTFTFESLEGKESLPSFVTHDSILDRTYVSDIGINKIHLFNKRSYDGYWAPETMFICPRSVICVPNKRETKDGQDVCVVDKSGLYQFDSDGKLKNEFFKGSAQDLKALAYDNDAGLLIILEKKPSGEVDLVFIRLETGETEKMITITSDPKAVCRFIAYGNGKVFTTNFGQSCYFVTDLKTETTTKHDLMSSSNVPLRALTGVAVDEKGTVLIVREGKFQLYDRTNKDRGNIKSIGTLPGATGIALINKTLFVAEYSHTVKIYEAELQS